MELASSLDKPNLKESRIPIKSVAFGGERQDHEADVLYIDFYNPPQSSDDTELTDDDIVIRYGDRDEIVGFTILHASTR